jgi:MEMO1 family protein
MAGEVVFAGIAPHPPLLVPEVGGARIERVRASVDALTEFSRQLVETQPETVVLISPHSPGDARKFGAFGSAQLHGDFQQFGAQQVTLSFPNDLELLDALGAVARERGIAFAPFAEDYPLDHGVLVPLYYLHSAGWNGPLLSLSFTALTRAEHLEFGRAMTAAAERVGRRVAFVASADLSHYLSEDGPYRFEPVAHLFDEQVCAAIADKNLNAIVDIDQDLRYRAGECGYRSILVAIGTVDKEPTTPRLLSYEGPYGVGYMVAILKEPRVL